MPKINVCIWLACSCRDSPYICHAVSAVRLVIWTERTTANQPNGSFDCACLELAVIRHGPDLVVVVVPSWWHVPCARDLNLIKAVHSVCAMEPSAPSTRSKRTHFQLLRGCRYSRAYRIRSEANFLGTIFFLAEFTSGTERSPQTHCSIRLVARFLQPSIEGLIYEFAVSVFK